MNTEELLNQCSIMQGYANDIVQVSIRLETSGTLPDKLVKLLQLLQTVSQRMVQFVGEICDTAVEDPVGAQLLIIMDFITPVTTVGTCMEVMKTHFEPDNETQRELLQTLETASEQLLNWVMAVREPI